MAKKLMYFQVAPERFSLYEKISREGELDFRKADSSDVEDKFYNKLIFVGKHKKLRGRITVKEQVTGTKFVLKVIPREGQSPEIKIYNNRLELRSNGTLSADQIVLSPKRAAGFYYSFRPEHAEDPEVYKANEEEATKRKEAYVGSVLEFFEDAKTCARNYKNDIRLQDREVQKTLKQLSRKLR